MLLKCNKGQIAILDLFIAAVMFGLIITTIMFTWNSYNRKIDSQIEYNEIVIKGFTVSELLSEYTGKPSAWEREGILTVVGLADETGVISREKLLNFSQRSYDDVRNDLNLVSFGFYFNLSDAVGNDFGSIVIGERGGNISVNVRRIVIYEGQEAVMEVAVYE